MYVLQMLTNIYLKALSFLLHCILLLLLSVKGDDE